MYNINLEVGQKIYENFLINFLKILWYLCVCGGGTCAHVHAHMGTCTDIYEVLAIKLDDLSLISGTHIV